MDAAQTIFTVTSPLNITTPPPVTHHIISGSFRSLSLFLLVFSPLHRTLSLVQEINAFGPHQYLATNPIKDRVYTTSWALPPNLSSWAIEGSDSESSAGLWKVSHVNSVSITATSSYLALPPPYTHIYSAGGPTGEVHLVDPSTGGFGQKLQQLLFVPEDELGNADKTRVALRYGSHAVEFSPSTHHAFIPVLGTNTIEMYSHDRITGLLTHLSSTPSPRGPKSHDGPRHVKVHPNGRVVYCITEHSNYIDAYTINPTSLSYTASRSLLPPHLRFSQPPNSSTLRPNPNFRGDTLLLAPSTPTHPTPLQLFATTRGATPAHKGWVTIFALDEEGSFSPSINKADQTEEAEEYDGGRRRADEGEEGGLERYETPTSGGKAHALDLLPKSLSLSSPSSPAAVWILLTDDSDSAASSGGGVRVLEWDGWKGGGVRVVVGWPRSGEGDGDGDRDRGERMRGGSHAVWLD